jgi:hypothetical protein
MADGMGIRIGRDERGTEDRGQITDYRGQITDYTGQRTEARSRIQIAYFCFK